MSEVSELVALSELATAGPWTAEGYAISAHHNAADPRLEYWLVERMGGDNRAEVAIGRPTVNAAFIAALVNWFRANAAALRTPPTPAGYDAGDVSAASAEGFRAGVASVGEDARDAARYRQIRKGLSDRHGDLYAMVFAGDGDYPVTGDTLDKLADAALAQPSEVGGGL